MIKKFFLTLVLILSLPIFLSSQLIGQEPQLPSNYVLRRDLYFETYQEYIAAKEAYLNQKTLERKKILFNRLENFLYARNRLVYVYFDFLIERLENQLRPERINNFKAWQQWLSESEREIYRINRVEDLEKLYLKANDLAEAFPEMQIDIYFGLTEFAIENQNEVINQIEDISSALKPLTDDQGWVTEVENKLVQAKNLQKEALAIMTEAQSRRRRNMRTSWASSQGYLSQAQSNLEVALDYLDEVIKRVE